MYKEYSVIDAHCETLLNVIGSNGIAGIGGRLDFFNRNEKSHIDLPKLLEGGVRCQFFALFLEPRDRRAAFWTSSTFSANVRREAFSPFARFRIWMEQFGAAAWRRCFR